MSTRSAFADLIAHVINNEIERLQLVAAAYACLIGLRGKYVYIHIYIYYVIIYLQICVAFDVNATLQNCSQIHRKK